MFSHTYISVLVNKINAYTRVVAVSCSDNNWSGFDEGYMCQIPKTACVCAFVSAPVSSDIPVYYTFGHICPHERLGTFGPEYLPMSSPPEVHYGSVY